MTEPSSADRGYAPPPQTPPSSGRPPLRRDNEAGFLGGVAAGVANHLGIDVVLVRIGFVVVTVFTQGLGALAYLLCWAFIPSADEDEQASTLAQRGGEPVEGRGSGFWVGVVLLTVGILWFLTSFQLPGAPFRFFDAGLVVPLLLIGLGVALWRGGGGPNGGGLNGGGSGGPGARPSATSPEAPVASSPWTPPAPSPPAPPAPAPSAADQRSDRPTGATSPQETPMTPSSSIAVIDTPAGRDPGDLPPPPAPPTGGSEGDGFTPPPVPERRRSILTRLTLGLALLVVGVLWIVEVTTDVSNGPVLVLAIGLAVIGVGLLIGSVIGRGRGLILVGLLLTPLVLLGGVLGGFPAGQLIESSIRGEVAVGEVDVRVEDEAELDELYQLGAGSLRLDLADLDLSQDREVTVRIGAGELEVVVPDDVTVDVSASLSGGEVRVLGTQRAGLGLSLSRSEPPTSPDADAPTLFLDIQVAFGQVTVQRLRPSPDQPESSPSASVHLSESAH